MLKTGRAELHGVANECMRKGVTSVYARFFQDPFHIRGISRVAHIPFHLHIAWDIDRQLFQSRLNNLEQIAVEWKGKSFAYGW